MKLEIDPRTGLVKLPRLVKLGDIVDMLYKLRMERAALSKLEDAVHKTETQLKEHCIKQFKKPDLQGARGKIAVAELKPKVVPQMKDWRKFCTYVKRENAFDLLQRRLNELAVKERWDNNKAVPGVDRFNTVVLSVNKVAERKRVKG